MLYFYMFSAVLYYWKLLEKWEKNVWLYTCWKDSKSFLRVNRDTITFKTWYINSNKAVFYVFRRDRIITDSFLEECSTPLITFNQHSSNNSIVSNYTIIQRSWVNRTIQCIRWNSWNGNISQSSFHCFW